MQANGSGLDQMADTIKQRLADAVLGCNYV